MPVSKSEEPASSGEPFRGDSQHDIIRGRGPELGDWNDLCNLWKIGLFESKYQEYGP